MLVFATTQVLTAMFEPPLMQFFADRGRHDRPEEIQDDLLNWNAEILGIQLSMGRGIDPWLGIGDAGRQVAQAAAHADADAWRSGGSRL